MRDESKEWLPNDSETLDRLVEAVCERLRRRRIGFLWSDDPVFPEPMDGFTWVHYMNSAHAGAPCCYAMYGIERPEAEGRTLDMLVVPGGSVQLLSELTSRFRFSRAARMICGAMEASIPVVFEPSRLLLWYGAADAGGRECLLCGMKLLRERGLLFPGFDLAPAIVRQDGAVVTLREQGWHAWTEVAPLVAEAKVLRLAEGVRLTAEAVDRLVKLNIRVEGA